jgi:hypothetical protein
MFSKLMKSLDTLLYTGIKFLSCVSLNVHPSLCALSIYVFNSETQNINFFLLLFQFHPIGHFENGVV